MRYSICRVTPALPFLELLVCHKNIGCGSYSSGVTRGGRAVRSGRHALGAAFLDKLYVIFLNNHYLFANRKSSYCVAQCSSAKLRKWARHLVYTSVYSREYNKDLILMSITSQLRTALFLVFASFESLTLSKPLLLDISCGNILALFRVIASLHALFR